MKKNIVIAILSTVLVGLLFSIFFYSRIALPKESSTDCPYPTAETIVENYTINSVSCSVYEYDSGVWICDEFGHTLDVMGMSCHGMNHNGIVLSEASVYASHNGFRISMTYNN